MFGGSGSFLVDATLEANGWGSVKACGGWDRSHRADDAELAQAETVPFLTSQHGLPLWDGRRLEARELPPVVALRTWGYSREPDQLTFKFDAVESPIGDWATLAFTEEVT